MKKLKIMLISTCILMISIAMLACGQTFSVKFDVNGGQGEYSEQIIPAGQYASRPSTDPTREGYNFKFWAYGTTEFKFEETFVTAHMTLKAEWEAISYTITYKNADGTTIANSGNPASYTIEDEITLAELTVEDGFEFVGWYTDLAVESSKVTSIANRTGDLVLFAKVAADAPITTHQVTFNTNGGTGTYTAQTINDGETAEEPTTDPTRRGYDFTFWAKQGTATAFDFDSEILADTVLVAQWQIINYDIEYVDANGDPITVAATNTKTFNVETTTVVLAAPTSVDPALHFHGWYIDITEEDTRITAVNFVTYVAALDPLGDITLVAKINDQTPPVYHLVTFNVSGGNGSITSVEVLEGGKVTEPDTSNVTKVNYEVDGWQLLDGTPFDFATDTITEPTTLYIVWAAKDFTITYKTHTGGSITTSNPTTYNIDSFFSLDPVVPEAGNVFAGWFVELGADDVQVFNSAGIFAALSNVLEDIVIYAKIGPNQDLAPLNGVYRGGGHVITIADGDVTKIVIPVSSQLPYNLISVVSFFDNVLVISVDFPGQLTVSNFIYTYNGTDSLVFTPNFDWEGLGNAATLVYEEPDTSDYTDIIGEWESATGSPYLQTLVVDADGVVSFTSTTLTTENLIFTGYARFDGTTLTIRVKGSVTQEEKTITLTYSESGEGVKTLTISSSVISGTLNLVPPPPPTAFEELIGLWIGYGYVVKIEEVADEVKVTDFVFEGMNPTTHTIKSSSFANETLTIVVTDGTNDYNFMLNYVSDDFGTSMSGEFDNAICIGYANLMTGMQVGFATIPVGTWIGETVTLAITNPTTFALNIAGTDWTISHAVFEGPGGILFIRTATATNWVAYEYDSISNSLYIYNTIEIYEELKKPDARFNDYIGKYLATGHVLELDQFGVATLEFPGSRYPTASVKSFETGVLKLDVVPSFGESAVEFVYTYDAVSKSFTLAANSIVTTAAQLILEGFTPPDPGRFEDLVGTWMGFGFVLEIDEGGEVLYYYFGEESTAYNLSLTAEDLDLTGSTLTLPLKDGSDSYEVKFTYADNTLTLLSSDIITVYGGEVLTKVPTSPAPSYTAVEGIWRGTNYELVIGATGVTSFKLLGSSENLFDSTKYFGGSTLVITITVGTNDYDICLVFTSKCLVIPGTYTGAADQLGFQDFSAFLGEWVGVNGIYFTIDSTGVTDFYFKGMLTEGLTLSYNTFDGTNLTVTLTDGTDKVLFGFQKTSAGKLKTIKNEFITLESTLELNVGFSTFVGEWADGTFAQTLSVTNATTATYNYTGIADGFNVKILAQAYNVIVFLTKNDGGTITEHFISYGAGGIGAQRTLTPSSSNTLGIPAAQTVYFLEGVYTSFAGTWSGGGHEIEIDATGITNFEIAGVVTSTSTATLAGFSTSSLVIKVGQRLYSYEYKAGLDALGFIPTASATNPANLRLNGAAPYDFSKFIGTWSSASKLSELVFTVEDGLVHTKHDLNTMINCAFISITSFENDVLTIQVRGVGGNPATAVLTYDSGAKTFTFVVSAFSISETLTKNDFEDVKGLWKGTTYEVRITELGLDYILRYTNGVPAQLNATIAAFDGTDLTVFVLRPNGAVTHYVFTLDNNELSIATNNDLGTVADTLTPEFDLNGHIGAWAGAMHTIVIEKVDGEFVLSYYLASAYAAYMTFTDIDIEDEKIRVDVNMVIDEDGTTMPYSFYFNLGDNCITGIDDGSGMGTDILTPFTPWDACIEVISGMWIDPATYSMFFIEEDGEVIISSGFDGLTVTGDVVISGNTFTFEVEDGNGDPHTIEFIYNPMSRDIILQANETLSIEETAFIKSIV